MLHNQALITTLPILIVDDNAINRIFLEKTLISRGFENLMCVHSGEEALACLDNFQPDLVLLDIMMPGIDGYECCARIRAQPKYDDLPILIQTSLNDPKLRVHAFEKGATDFVSKPIYPDELCARVQVHLEKRRLLKDLKIYKHRIESEMETARHLQLSILPNLADVTHIRNQCKLTISDHFQPSSELGGDFWGVKALADDLVALWLVDFSGHGVASALNSFRLQAYLMEHSPIAAEPGEYLSHLNEKMLRLLVRGQFATMFYGVIDTGRNLLSYACASAPKPIVLHENAPANMIDGTGVPLGIVSTTYPTQTIPFAATDTLLIYSDALIETPDAAGAFISEEKIVSLLSTNEEPAVLKSRLAANFATHAETRIQDDLTFVICKRM